MTEIENAIDRTSSDRAPWAPSNLAGLLKEPAIETWAREAASERLITPLDALGLLARALSLDPER